jgi:tRNA threonylcarbamoyladenosine biosynthesis protein TsaB
VPEPLVLGIETSGLWTGVALLRGETALFSESLGPGTDHNELVVSLLDRAFRSAGVEPAALAGIGVTVGPGMFTSLRVGVAAAKALAMADACPLRGIGTLAALAATAGGSGAVLTVVDAHKGQVYVALWSGGTARLEPAVVDVAAVADWLGTGLKPVSALRLAGSGTGLCVEILRAAGFDCLDTGIAVPDPVAVARMAAADIAAGRIDGLADLEPRYLRRTDAELARDKRTGN